MPPPLPTRYRLEVRLGRDGDVEEWFATDLRLHRPVLIRAVGPEATAERRHAFLIALRRAARVSHNHVAAVFDADRAAGTAYAVTEWTGGISLSDRIEAGDTPPIAEFLSNAAGLADGLAALHDQDAVHGAIDPGAVLYPGSHPAKLGGFGRPRLTHSPAGDVRALGSALETALTGHPAGTLPPSQVIDALPAAVDDALHLARESRIDARRLAEVVRSIPYSPAPRRTSRWSWGRLAPTAVLASAAVALVWLGVLLDSGTGTPDAPVLPGTLAVRSGAAAVPPPVGTTQPPPATTPPMPVVVERVTAFDPLGDGEERSADAGSVVDGDLDTSWRTERYRNPLPVIKEGVGLAFEVAGSPVRLELVGLSEGTGFRVMWAGSLLDIWDERWDIITEERAGASTSTLIHLPARSDGVWLLWLTDLPSQGDSYLAGLSEVYFHP